MLSGLKRSYNRVWHCVAGNYRQTWPNYSTL